MKLIEKIHGSYIHQHRVESLQRGLLKVLPATGSVLDVGCGDGLLAAQIQQSRPGLQLTGIDVLVRPETHVPVTSFDGQLMPHDDDSFDVVMFVDVLHHTENPAQLLAEACRVSRQWVVMKDHNRDGWLAESTLRFMDRIGNQRYGVELPYNYLSRLEWETLWQQTGLDVDSYLPRIDLYPGMLKPFFERQLHFIARLKKNAA